MPLRRLHELYWANIENNKKGYLDTAKIVLKLLNEGLKIYGNDNEYRFTLNEIMRRLNKSEVKITRRKAGCVVYALLKRNELSFYSNPGNGRRVYETVLDRKKIEELEEEIKKLEEDCKSLLFS